MRRPAAATEAPCHVEARGALWTLAVAALRGLGCGGRLALQAAARRRRRAVLEREPPGGAGTVSRAAVGSRRSKRACAPALLGKVARARIRRRRISCGR